MMMKQFRFLAVLLGLFLYVGLTAAPNNVNIEGMQIDVDVGIADTTLLTVVSTPFAIFEVYGNCYLEVDVGVSLNTYSVNATSHEAISCVPQTNMLTRTYYKCHEANELHSMKVEDNLSKSEINRGVRSGKLGYTDRPMLIPLC